MQMGDVFTVANRSKQWVIATIEGRQIVGREISPNGYIEKTKRASAFSVEAINLSGHNVFFERPFADRIRKVKDLLGIKSIKDFAAKIEVSPSYFKALDYLSLGLPSETDMDMIKRISRSFNIPIELLTDGLERPYSTNSIPIPTRPAINQAIETSSKVNRNTPEKWAPAIDSNLKSDLRRRLRDIERLIEELLKEKSYILERIGNENENRGRKRNYGTSSADRNDFIIQLLQQKSPMTLVDIKHEVESNGLHMGSNLSLAMNEVIKYNSHVVRTGRGIYSYEA